MGLILWMEQHQAKETISKAAANDAFVTDCR